MITKEQAMEQMVRECYDDEIMKSIGKTRQEGLEQVVECAARHGIPPEMFQRIHRKVQIALNQEDRVTTVYRKFCRTGKVDTYDEQRLLSMAEPGLGLEEIERIVAEVEAEKLLASQGGQEM